MERDLNDRVAAGLPPESDPVLARDDAPYVERPTYARPLLEDRPHRRFSLGATFLGWCVAAFLSLLMLVLVASFVGGAASGANDDGISTGELNQLGIGALVGSAIAMFLAYLVGGYAAGRIARWAGAKHGAMVPVWSIVVGLLLGPLLGAIAGASGALAYDRLAGAFGNVDFGDLTSGAIVGLLLSLVAMFAGAILGGKLGERSEERYLGAASARERRIVDRPGRPF